MSWLSRVEGRARASSVSVPLSDYYTDAVLGRFQHDHETQFGPAEKRVLVPRAIYERVIAEDAARGGTGVRRWMRSGGAIGERSTNVHDGRSRRTRAPDTHTRPLTSSDRRRIEAARSKMRQSGDAPRC